MLMVVILTLAQKIVLELLLAMPFLPCRERHIDNKEWDLCKQHSERPAKQFPEAYTI